MSSKAFGRLLVLPAAGLLLLVGTGPLLYAAWSAFHRFPADAEPEFAGLANLGDLARDPQFVRSCVVTGIVLVAAVSLELVLGLGLALALHRIRRGRGLLVGLLLIPSSVAPLVAGIAWWMLFNPRYGPVNAVLGLAGIAPVEWTVRMPWALAAIVVALVWQWTPFVAVILLGGLTTLPASVVEAARIDGAGPWRMLRHVTLPHLRPFFLVAGLLMIIEVVRLYEVPFYITQGGPGNETVLSGVYLFKLAFNFRNLGGASMMALLFVAVLGVAASLYVRLVTGRPQKERIA
jgi:multiple sugar transport system permease protein